MMSKEITIVTGNPNKLRELQRLFPSDYVLSSIDLDLEEIQSLDPLHIATEKVKAAYSVVQKPVIVDDISAGLDDLQGLPGPFIKYFEEKLGRGALHKLAGKEAACTLTAILAFYDGSNIICGKGELKGTVVAPRDGEGFGFDFVFIPEGYTQTFSEMGPLEKDKISHRTLALQDLIRQLQSS